MHGLGWWNRYLFICVHLGVVHWGCFHCLSCPSPSLVHLCVYQPDVEDEDTLKAVEAAVGESTSVRRIDIYCHGLKWTNVATALLKGVAENKSMRELTLHTTEDYSPTNDVVDEVKQKRKRLVLNIYV